MKKFWFFPLLGALCLISSCSIPNAGAGFYQDHKRKDGVRNFALPGWLIYTGTGFAHDMVKDEEVQVLLQVARRVKKMQFMLDEGNGAISQTDVAAFQDHLRQRNFDDLIYVRADDTTISFMVHSKKDKLRDLIMLVHTDEDFVFLNMRTSIRVKHLARMIEAVMQLDESEEKAPAGEPVSPEVEKPIARPRA